MAKNRKLYVTSALLCCLIALLSSCRFGRRPAATPVPISLPTQFANLASTEDDQLIFTAQRGKIVQEEIYAGKIVLSHQDELFFRRGGRVARVYVEDGARVKAGDFIAELDSRALELDLEISQLYVEIAQEQIKRAEDAREVNRRQAQLNVDIANLYLQNAIAEATRFAPTMTPQPSATTQPPATATPNPTKTPTPTARSSITGTAIVVTPNSRQTTRAIPTASATATIPSLPTNAAPPTATAEVRLVGRSGRSVTIEILQNELTGTQLSYDSIDTEVNPILLLNFQQAELGVEKAKQAILDGQLIAPFAGEVRFTSLRGEEEQQAVGAFEVVARLVDPTQFRIELNLTRIQMEPLYEGMPVDVVVIGNANRPIPGKIAALPRPFGKSDGSLVEITIANPAADLPLVEGMNVSVNVKLESSNNAVVVPREALRQRDQLYYLLLKEGEERREVNVAVGILGDEMVEILAGIEPGQTIVIDN